MRNFKRPEIPGPVNHYQRLNADSMHHLRIKQVKYEVDSWKRLLQFLIEENIHMKNRLSEILSGPFDYKLLERLDSFQARFVQTDALLSLIRHYVAEVEALLAEKETAVDRLTGTYPKLRILHHSVMNAEKIILNLESDFNGYLSDYV